MLEQGGTRGEEKEEEELKEVEEKTRGREWERRSGGDGVEVTGVPGAYGTPGVSFPTQHSRPLTLSLG